MRQFLRFENVSFTYPSMLNPLLENVNAHFMPGWTGIVGANGSGKSTLLRLASGELEPTSGTIHQLGSSVYVLQRTDDPPEDWHEFLESDDFEADEWRRKLNISLDWHDRWDTLSHGERKRSQIAVALWKQPELLALDEPTNHIDADARRLLIDNLRQFRGVGLLVSHDRELLDALCRQCLFIFPPNAVMRSGGVTVGMEEDRREQADAREKYDQASGAARRLREAAQQSREAAQQRAAAHKNDRNKIAPLHDHDGRFQRRLAKLSNKDEWGMKQGAALNKRAQKLDDSRNGLNIRKEYKMGFWLEDHGCSTRNHVLKIAAGELPLGGGRTLHFPELALSATDRVALTGPNGFGKSTLICELLNHVNVPKERLIYIPQEISAAESRDILEDVSRLPKEQLGRVMTSVSELGSRPGRLLESEQSSPGEIRKILLALGVNRGPHLIIMDEPTNHMDLPSIQCLEDALADCPCALLLVSHDEHFLRQLVDIRWHLQPDNNGSDVYLEISRNFDF